MRQRYFISIVISLIFLVATFVYADDSFKQWNNPRDYDPVVLKESSLPADLLSLPITELFVYAYDLSSDTWTQIPFQFDKYDADNDRFIAPQAGDVFTVDDEFLFMARDMGDHAPDGSYWIDNEESKNYPRIEISATDGEQQAWVYVYRSTSITRSTVSYMTYVPPAGSDGQDQIIAETYTEGHNPEGIPNSWILPDGNGSDILDRQKMRIILEIEFLGYIIDYPADEDLLTGFLDRIEIREGPVRILREVFWTVDIGFGYDPIPFGLPLQYYPYTIQSDGVSGTFTEANHVNYIRQSFDLSPAASGMTFYNPYNQAGVAVTGSGGDKGIDKTAVDPPATNWYMFTGSQGTYGLIFKIPTLGDSRSLYFYESQSSTAGDGTLDTGDGRSYGDTGIQIQGTDIAGRISFSYSAFYLGSNKNYSLGETLAANFDAPLVTDAQPVDYVEYVDVAMAVPDTAAAEASTITIPVTIGDLSGLNMTGVIFDLTFDTSILTAVSASVAATIADGWATPTITNTDSGVNISMSGATALTGSGELVNIEFSVIGDDGESTALTLQNINFTPFNLVGVPTAGSFTVEPGQVIVSLPDTSKASGTSISIPVITSDLTDLDVTDITLAISFDPAILNATGFSKNGTLTESWADPTYYDLTNRIALVFTGTTPLLGAGPLVYINFDISGPDSAVSYLNFISATFNSGSPLSVKQNGSLRVDGVVPVELVSFEAYENNGQVMLSWSTATESNNYGFEIQRQTIEADLWSKIGFVEGNGTTSIPQSYTFVDQGIPAGRYAYRLKQIDFDGAFDLSDAIEVTINVATRFALEQNYPNPFNPDTKIDYRIPDSINGDILVDVSVYNMLGRKIKTLVLEKKSPGFYTAYWDGRDEQNNIVSTGIYIYRLQAGKFSATRRMVLMK